MSLLEAFGWVITSLLPRQKFYFDIIVYFSKIKDMMFDTFLAKFVDMMEDYKVYIGFY